MRSWLPGVGWWPVATVAAWALAGAALLALSGTVIMPGVPRLYSWAEVETTVLALGLMTALAGALTGAVLVFLFHRPAWAERVWR